MSKKNVLVAYGTRPEAIKLARLVLALQADGQFQPKIVFSGQHNELIESAHQFFGLVPEYTLNVMAKNQSLDEVHVKVVEGISDILREVVCSLLVVQVTHQPHLRLRWQVFFNGYPLPILRQGFDLMT